MSNKENSLAPPRKRRFIQCDVFSPTPGKGNGLAVVLDAEGLSTDTMQNFAAWTNLAETAFLFEPSAPDADYLVRIFSPTREMPFAGHPTLGSCASWLHVGNTPQATGTVRQECGIGVLDVDVRGEAPHFLAPPVDVSEIPPASYQRCLTALGLDHGDIVRAAHLNNGRALSVFELRSSEDVVAVDAAHVRAPEFDGIGLLGRHPDGADVDYEVRMLAPASGAAEDPITGSLNAALARWLYGIGVWRGAKIIAQGTRLSRQGRVHLSQTGSDVWVGGRVNVLIDGYVTL